MRRIKTAKVRFGSGKCWSCGAYTGGGQCLDCMGR